MRTLVASLALVLVVSLSGTTWAQSTVTIDWQEHGSNIDINKRVRASGPINFKESGLTVTATAYSGGGVGSTGYGSSYNPHGRLTGRWSQSSAFSHNDLYAKDTSRTETGLGLTSDRSGDHEITHGHGILLDFSNVPATAQPFTITFNSVQSSSGDEAGVYDFTKGSTNYEKLVGTIATNDKMTVTIGPNAKDLQYLITEVNAPNWCYGDWNPNVLLGSITLNLPQQGGGNPPSSTPEPSNFLIGAVGSLAFIGYGVRHRRARV